MKKSMEFIKILFKNNMLDSLVIALTNTDNNEANIKRTYVLKIIFCFVPKYNIQ